MELLKLVETDSLEKIKEFLTSNSIPNNSKWLDYSALNSALEYKRKDVAKLMLDQNFRVNRTGKSATAANTPLHHAAKMDDVELVNSLLLKKASIVAFNEEGDTPLHIAFMNRNDPIVDVILASIKSAKVSNPKNQRGLSHFHIACIRNNQTAVNYFLKSGVDIEDTVNTDSLLWPGYTPLHFAVEFNSFQVVKLLLDAGANKKAENVKGLMPLDLANVSFTDISILSYYLADEDKDISSNHNRISNFHVACIRGDVRLVESFINNGAGVNSKVSNASVFCPSYSPLHFAVESNEIESVKLLVKHGGNPEIKNGYYMTPLHLALYNDDHKKKDTIVDFLYSMVKNKEKDCTDLNGLTYFHIACSRNNTELVKKFLDQGEDVNGQILYNLKNFSLYTPLHFAARYSCIETAELLIKRGANVNRSDNGMHGTPLHLAFENGNSKMIELLTKNGADVSILRPYDDRTMLHIFVEQAMDSNSRADPMKVFEVLDDANDDVKHRIGQLIKSGCSLDAKDADGNTALHIACSNLTNGSAIAEILLEYGADINLENNEGNTPFDCTFHDVYTNNAEDYMTIYHHVQKLKDLGVTVNPKNVKCCEKLLRDKDECDPRASCFMEKNIDKKHQQRLEEIDKMKKVKVDKGTSLYQILFEEVKKISLICKNNEIKKIMEQKNFSKLYPWYGSMLQLQYQRGLTNLKSMAFDKLMAVEEVAEPRAKRKRR